MGALRLRSCVALSVVLVAAPAARAAERPAPPVPAAALPAPGGVPPPPEREWGLGALEILVGSATAFILVVGAFQMGDPLEPGRSGRDTLAAASLLAVPAAQGFVVCTLGSTSHRYGGSCGWPILGAYAGMAPFVPLALLSSSSQPDALGKGIVAALWLGAGFALGAPVGATVAWNVQKIPRRQPDATVWPVAAPRLLEPSVRRAALVAPPRFMVPIVAASF